MEKVSKKTSRLLFVIILLVSILIILIRTQTDKQSTLPAYFLANEAYRTGDFKLALERYYESLKENPGLIRKDPLVRFKIGHSFYKTENFENAIAVFEKGRSELKQIEDYLYYFKLLSYLNMGDTLNAYIQMKTLYRDFRDSPLIPLVDSIKAHIALKKEIPDTALKYLQRTLEKGRSEKTEIYLNMLKVFDKLEKITEYREYAYRFLARYPFHDRASDVYENLLRTYDGKIENQEIKSIFNYLFTTKQFIASEKLLAEQTKFIAGDYERDYFNWIPVEIAYRQGEYKRVLDWCLSKRKFFNDIEILREIDLHIARCYLRTGQIKMSIEAYLEFQKRYPKDQLSPEVLWKVAWLYEEIVDIPKAIRTYKKLVSTYRNCSFNDESYFRIGLDYYRLKQYKKARKEWTQALQRIKKNSSKDRIKFWIGKSYEAERDFKKQGEIYIELAKRPIDSFYNLKAFYLTSNGQDTHSKINEVLWELHQETYSYLPMYINSFTRSFQVEEVLGSRWGDLELQEVDLDPKEWKAVFALGELYERMKNFGVAYRKFRSIFNSHFSKSDLTEMIPIFKKLYPFYFTEPIDSAAIRFSIPKGLVLSVIKKESAFESRIISYANAYGLMQLLPGTASQVAPNLGVRYNSSEQLFNPEYNIMMGCYYLSALLRRYQGNYFMALAGYNAGPHRVDRWKKRYPTDDDDLFMENIEFEQTRVYVRTCMKYYWLYQAIMNPGQIPEEIVNYPVKISDFI